MLDKCDGNSVWHVEDPNEPETKRPRRAVEERSADGGAGSSGDVQMDARMPGGREGSSGDAPQLVEEEPDIFHTSPSSSAPDWNGDSEAKELHEDLKRKEEEVLDGPVLLADLGHVVYEGHLYGQLKCQAPFCCRSG